MKFADFMRAQKIELRVERSAAAKARIAEKPDYRFPSQERFSGEHFPNLTDGERERLAALGIDPEQSYLLFQVEIQVQPPDMLLDDLFELPGDGLRVEAA